jgi:L-alanine-DL-glutamate epimerase-like enolase superfamily enzyme
MAISDVDNALWDLRARLLHLSVTDLLGRARESIAVYGSGGFTSYSDAQIKTAIRWLDQSRADPSQDENRSDPESDVARVQSARDAIGPDADCLLMPKAPTIASRPSQKPPHLPTSA